MRIERNAAELLAAARAETGICIDDSDAIEPLQRFLKALNEEANMHARGAKGMEGFILRMLRNRLRMKRDLAAHPEILDQPLLPPLFLCGSGRTGSTKMQRILAASGDFNWISYWMTLNPSLVTGDPAEDPKERIADIEAFEAWFDEGSPETKFGHAFETHEPEEESFILGQSLRSPVVLAWGPIDSYLAWVAEQDMTTQLIYLRDTLKYLQWQELGRADKPWLLKCPLYPGMERELLSVFPDARLVMTHRDPQSLIPSGLRLLELFHRPYTHKRSSSANYVAGVAASMERHLDNRQALGERLNILDIGFREITRDVMAVIERVYEFANMDLSAEARENMLRWELNNPPHQHGRHEYRLEDYGVTRDQVDRAFLRYTRFLAEVFGDASVA